MSEGLQSQTSEGLQSHTSLGGLCAGLLDVQPGLARSWMSWSLSSARCACYVLCSSCRHSVCSADDENVGSIFSRASRTQLLTPYGLPSRWTERCLDDLLAPICVQCWWRHRGLVDALVGSQSSGGDQVVWVQLRGRQCSVNDAPVAPSAFPVAL